MLLNKLRELVESLIPKFIFTLLFLSCIPEALYQLKVALSPRQFLVTVHRLVVGALLSDLIRIITVNIIILVRIRGRISFLYDSFLNSGFWLGALGEHVRLQGS